MKNYWKSGDWNARCDSCGFKFKASELKDRWDNMKVCNECWEPYHPQLLLRVPVDTVAPKWVRPDPEEIYISVDYIATSVGTQETTIPSGHNNGAL